MTKINLHLSWSSHLKEEFEKKYMRELNAFLKTELDKGKTIFPKENEAFEAFNQTPFDKVKVVIIGQDPYHGENQAHGMSFSVKRGVRTPPSLVNIYKELKSDLNISPASHGHLQKWANEGVLLLNSVLTVEKSNAGSHRKRGWELFTDKVIELLNEKKENLVFILWGGPAQKKASKVDERKHLVLKAPHPSPLSSYRGFFGSKPFSKTNEYLKQKGIGPIDWRIN